MPFFARRSTGGVQTFYREQFFCFLLTTTYEGLDGYLYFVMEGLGHYDIGRIAFKNLRLNLKPNYDGGSSVEVGEFESAKESRLEKEA